MLINTYFFHAILNRSGISEQTLANTKTGICSQTLAHVLETWSSHGTGNAGRYYRTKRTGPGNHAGLGGTQMKLKLSACSIVFFILSGCNIQNLQESKPDLESIVQTEQQASTAYQNEDWKTAEKAYLEITRKAPSQAEPWFRLGNIYARTNRLDEAVTAYRNALLRNSDYSKAWHNLGIVHLRQATTTFKDMLQHTSKDDPLNQRAIYIVNAVSDLMASGFETSNEN